MKLASRTTFLSLVGLFLIALFVPLCAAQDASTGLSLEVMLRLHSTNATIVQNNVTQPGFRPGDGGLSVHADTTVSTLYFQVLPSSTTEDGDDSSNSSPHQGYLIIQSFTIKVSPEATCYPFLYLRGMRVTFPLSLGVGIGNSIALDLHYNCTVARSANITSSIEIQGGPKIHFAWEKETSPNRLGFNVGTFLFLPDVAYDGVVLSDWSPESHTVQVSAGILSSPFNFWMALTGEKQVITSYSLTAKPDYCQPYVSGDISVITNMLTSVLVVYNCTQNGTATITMELELEGGFSPLVAVWTKQSGGYRQDFLVGTQAGASDVIWWGLTLPLWSDYHFVMHPDVKSSTFYFVMNDAGDTQFIGTPLLNFDASVMAVMLSGDLAYGGIVNNTVQSLTITYDCQIQGSTPMQISVPMPGYEPAVWRWTKQCGITRSDWNIGTRPGYDDVVSAGSPTFLYSPTLHTAFVFPDTAYSTFYFSLSSSESSSPKSITAGSEQEKSELTKQPFQAAVIKSISLRVARPSCTPFLGGNATVGAEIPLDGNLAMTVTYNCTKPGNTNVSVTIVLTGPYAPVTFTWLKRVGEGRNALIIGTIRGYDDVVSGGVATPLYSPATFSAFYGPWQQSADFYLQLTNNYSTQVINSITASTSFPLGCWPQVKSSWGSFGPWGSQGTLIGESIHHISVSWNCSIGGKSVTTVTFDLQDWGPLVVSMNVYSGGPRPYLDIGTLRGAADVVMGGIATPLWIPGPLNGATVSGNVLNTTFWLGMGQNQTQYMFAPLMTVQTSDNILSPYLLGSFINGGYVDSSYQQTLTVVYNCSKLGIVPISIGFLLPPYDSITFTWNKICSAERLGFIVGTTEGNFDVVQDGQATMAYNPLTHVAFVTGTTLQTRFYVGELQGSQLISAFSVTSSQSICSPYITGGIYPGIVIQEKQFVSFKVIYNCSDIGKTNIEVTLQLSGNFMPVTFMWTKRVYGVFTGLSVGTTEAFLSEDVIYQGSPTFAYDPISHTYLSSLFTSTYYAHLLSIPTPMTSVQFLPTVAFSFSPWLLPDVSGPLSAAYNFSDDTTTSFSVTPHCLLSSELLDDYASVYVAVTAVPFSPSIFSFFADCPPNVMGLSVGFGDPLASDVVKDGIPTDSWSPANKSRIEIEADYNILSFWVSSSTPTPLELASILIAEDGIIITEPLSGELHQSRDFSRDSTQSSDKHSSYSYEIGETNQARIYNIMNKKSRVDHATAARQDVVENHSSQFVVHERLPEMASPLVDVTDVDSDSPKLGYPKIPAPACRAVLSGQVWDYLTLTNIPQLLQIELNCTIGGTNNVSVILVPKDKKLSSTVWTFSKTMGGFRHGFDITVLNPETSLDSNTSKSVMMNGEPLPQWSPTEPTATEKTNNAFMSFSLRLSRVYFGRDPLQDFFAPSITSWPPGICNPILLGNASLGGLLERESPLRLDVLANCYGVSPIVTTQISIPIPPFTAAVYSWRRASQGIPPFLNVDAQTSLSKPERSPAIINGVSTHTLPLASDGFRLWFYLSPGSLPSYAVSSPNITLQLLPPVVNTTTPNCAFVVSGNATDEESLNFNSGPLMLQVKLTNCSSTSAEFSVNITASPYTTPITVRFAKSPAPPAKPKFPGALVGIIIGSTLVIILAISIGLYLCLRRPANIPSTGAYHMKRRQKEKKEQARALLSDGNESDPTIN